MSCSWTAIGTTHSLLLLIRTYSAGELDKILQHFFSKLVKSDGTDYEPQSL